MAQRGGRGFAGLVLAATLSGGCSFFYVRPSANHPLETSTCTDRPVWPVVDTLAAGAAAAAAFYAGSRSDQNQPRDAVPKEDAVIGYAVIGGFFAGSALVGYSRVDDCRQAKLALAAPAPPR